MYTNFYKLETKPFQISSDPEFLWLGEKHKEALATLKYGVLDNKGFLLLTGDVGTGKTTLIHSLIESLNEDVIFASIPDPLLAKLDFFNFIAFEFGINQEFASKVSFLIGFRQFLINANESGKKVLLIIDEAQLLTQELLEEIRLLSNIEKTNVKLINIFFVGQIEFNDSLNMPQNRAVRQRLTLNYNIDPLTLGETGEYIRYRLKVAGAEHEIFEPEAVREIFMYSGGFPRRINIICDHALLSGYVQDKETIDAVIIRECANDLKIPVCGRKSSEDGSKRYPSYNRPQGPVAPGPQPRPVIIQSKPSGKPQGNLSKNLFIGTAGLFIIALIIGYLFFAGFFDGVADSGRKDQLKKIQTEIVSVTSEGEHQEKKLPVPRERPPEKKVPPPLEPALDETTQQTHEISKLPEPEKETIPFPQKLDSAQEVSVFPESEAGKDEIRGTDKQPEPLPTEKIMIRFKYNTNEFTDQGLEALTGFADILAYHPEARIKITGYTDSAGSQNYNERLSEFRANIVKVFLLGRGADTDQFVVSGRGAQNPIISNETAWGRMMNRRVEIEVIK